MKNCTVLDRIDWYVSTTLGIGHNRDWLSSHHRVTVPVDVGRPAEWSDADVDSLKIFVLRTPLTSLGVADDRSDGTFCWLSLLL